MQTYSDTHRHTHGHSHRHRETLTQTLTHAQTHPDTETQIQSHRHTHRHTHSHRCIPAHIGTGSLTNIFIHRLINRPYIQPEVDPYTLIPKDTHSNTHCHMQIHSCTDTRV